MRFEAKCRWPKNSLFAVHWGFVYSQVSDVLNSRQIQHVEAVEGSEFNGKSFQVPNRSVECVRIAPFLLLSMKTRVFFAWEFMAKMAKFCVKFLVSKWSACQVFFIGHRLKIFGPSQEFRTPILFLNWRVDRVTALIYTKVWCLFCQLTGWQGDGYLYVGMVSLLPTDGLTGWRLRVRGNGVSFANWRVDRVTATCTWEWCLFCQLTGWQGDGYLYVGMVSLLPTDGLTGWRLPVRGNGVSFANWRVDRVTATCTWEWCLFCQLTGWQGDGYLYGGNALLEVICENHRQNLWKVHEYTCSLVIAKNRREKSSCRFRRANTCTFRRAKIYMYFSQSKNIHVLFAEQKYTCTFRRAKIYMYFSQSKNIHVLFAEQMMLCKFYRANIHSTATVNFTVHSTLCCLDSQYRVCKYRYFYWSCSVIFTVPWTFGHGPRVLFTVHRL